MKDVDELKNKILNMDCLEGVKLLPNDSVDLAVLDPPYGDVVNADWDKGDNPFTLELVNEVFRVLKPTGSFYIWCGIGEKSQSMIDFFCLMKQSKFFFKDLITWKKQRGIGMRKGWLYTREECLWYVKDNKKFIWNKDKQYSDEKRAFNVVKKNYEMINKSEYKRFTNVWTDINEFGMGNNLLNGSKIRKELGHLTPKPIKAIQRIIELHTQPNDVVLDCFMGSGSTAVACKSFGEDLNRNYIGFEINKEYIDIENQRLEDINNTYLN